MTDLELKELVASLALAQRKTDDLLTEIAAENKKLLLSQQKTDEQLAKIDARLTEIGDQLAETDKQTSDTDEWLDRLTTMYGDTASSPNMATREFYFNSLGHNPVLRGIHFESVCKNLSGSHQDIRDTYDIVLFNDQDTFIIEVKYKVHPNDLNILINKKVANFKILCPLLYKDHRLHLGLASFHLDDETIQSALEQGITVLQRKGDLIETTPATPLH